MTIPSLDRYIAMDCETVRTRAGHVLAKVGMVDHFGTEIYQSYVFVDRRNVTDWITRVHGIKPGDLDDAPRFQEVQAKIKEILKDKILVGHAVFNDLSWVQHRHPYEDVRDTCLYYPLRKSIGVEREGEYPGLKKLYLKAFGEEIQKDIHCPVEDARAAMRLFMSVRKEFEQSLAAGEDCISGMPAAYQKWFW
ncbi:ribonuclease H-like domain-containing protein [Kockovaella imperatae]|uniref:Ribonuclease H-like domain-containing protein n=1 Tax=Kockovaella imperatae TaxID=4999 RepID=A0A1Y1UER0_9TREE|nr:ribonuclease H-like domain-containing protein [Kockovaella imperatae]ORX35555.1 ribonuclease H-like domain-containing protein [Kockovaella imperatae]